MGITIYNFQEYIKDDSDILNYPMFFDYLRFLIMNIFSLLTFGIIPWYDDFNTYYNNFKKTLYHKFAFGDKIPKVLDHIIEDINFNIEKNIVNRSVLSNKINELISENTGFVIKITENKYDKQIDIIERDSVIFSRELYYINI